jgi:DNA-binding NtrC family response regulator
LRVLEDGHYRRVGSTKEVHADVRIVAATNKRLEEETRKGRFREDLYHRLNVVAIRLPPLRERREDIPELVSHFLTTRRVRLLCYQVQPETLQALCNYAWPGNVRELANVLERAQILAEGPVLTLDDLPENIAAAEEPLEDVPAGPLSLREVERQHVAQVLQRMQGNKLQSAKALGISRRALYRLICKHKLAIEALTSEPVPMDPRR